MKISSREQTGTVFKKNHNFIDNVWARGAGEPLKHRVTGLNPHASGQNPLHVRSLPKGQLIEENIKVGGGKSLEEGFTLTFPTSKYLEMLGGAIAGAGAIDGMNGIRFYFLVLRTK